MQPPPMPTGSSPAYASQGAKFLANIPPSGGAVARWNDEFAVGATDLLAVDAHSPTLSYNQPANIPTLIFGALAASSRLQYAGTAGPAWNPPFSLWGLFVINNASSKVNRLIGLGTSDFGIVVDGTAGVVRCGPNSAPLLTYTGRLPQGVPVAVQADFLNGSTVLWINNVQVALSANSAVAPPQGLTVGGLGSGALAAEDLAGQVLAATCMVGTMSQSLRIALYTWAQAVEVAGVARRAWLITPPATAQLPLDDPVSGYACTTLDLGAPNIREVKNPAPDRMGTIDRTAFYADRVVTATMVAWPGGTVTMDDCLRKFEAACHPLNRPELHWTEESALGEKMLTLRVVSMPATFIHPDHLDFQLQWVASDPVVRSVIVNIVTNGVTGGPWPTNAFATPTSNLRTWPKLVLHGPYTGSGAKVALQTGGGPTNLAPTTFTFTLSASAPNLTAGHTVTFDAVARTITDDAGTDYIANGYINWAQTTMGWPVILPGCYATPQMTLTGTDPANTRLDVSWQESYLS